MAQFQSQWWSSVVEAVKDVAGFDEDKNIYKVEVGRYIEILHFFPVSLLPMSTEVIILFLPFFLSDVLMFVLVMSMFWIQVFS